MKTTIVLVLSVMAQAIGNTCLSKGMKSVASLDQFGESFSLWMLMQAFETPMIWVGTFFLLVFFILFSAALTWADLSFVLPASSFGYILNVAFAHHFLDEVISPIRWAGTILIFLGVILVSRSAGSGGRKAEASEDMSVVRSQGALK